MKIPLKSLMTNDSKSLKMNRSLSASCTWSASTSLRYFGRWLRLASAGSSLLSESLLPLLLLILASSAAVYSEGSRRLILTSSSRNLRSVCKGWSPSSCTKQSSKAYSAHVAAQNSATRLSLLSLTSSSSSSSSELPLAGPPMCSCWPCKVTTSICLLEHQLPLRPAHRRRLW